MPALSQRRPRHAQAQTSTSPHAQGAKKRTLCALQAEPRAATVLLLRDGLACCRLASRRKGVSPQLRPLHSVIARALAKLIVESCDDGDASCGSLVEAEGMLREVLPFDVDLIKDDSWQHKASILKAIAELRAPGKAGATRGGTQGEAGSRGFCCRSTTSRRAPRGAAAAGGAVVERGGREAVESLAARSLVSTCSEILCANSIHTLFGSKSKKNRLHMTLYTL